VTTATEAGVATPITFAAGGGFIAAELPPPQALNSSATMVINEAVMVFTTGILLKFGHVALRASGRQLGGAVWVRWRVPRIDQHSLMELTSSF